MPSAERAVRINSVGSGLELDDLASIVASRRLEAIVIPKVDSAAHVRYVADYVAKYSPEYVPFFRLLAWDVDGHAGQAKYA